MPRRVESLAGQSLPAGARAAAIPERAAGRWRASVALAAAAVATALTLAHPHLKAALDRPFEAWLNQAARRYPWLDYGLGILDNYPAFQGVALMALLCGALVDARKRADALQVMAGVIAASLGAVLSRAVQHFLPASPRPLYDQALHFLLPLGGEAGALRDHTSYPSDHAALLGGLACALWLVRPRLGLVALAWVAILGFARIYDGYHYLTDTVGGWLYGAAVVFAVAALPLHRLDPVLAWAWRRRFWAAAFLFFSAVEAAALFDDVRGVARFVWHALSGAPDLTI